MAEEKEKKEEKANDRIRIESRLTDRQYRDYMNFHVLGNRRDVAQHCIISALIVLFGLINFRAGSPILGWIFVTLGIYVFVSRFVRFYLSVNRISEQFGLSREPKFFYMLTFPLPASLNQKTPAGGDDLSSGISADRSGDLSELEFEVRNEKESAKYPLSRVCRCCFLEKRQMVYLYLTKANAFLLPFESFTEGSPEDLKALLKAGCGEDKVSVLEK